MSRAPPFPTSSTRWSKTDDYDYLQDSFDQPPRQPTLPQSRSPYIPTSGPSRPQRSEQRTPRGSDYTYRNSSSTTRSKPAFLDNDLEESPVSPTSLPSVLSAFKAAGARRRNAALESENIDTERQRSDTSSARQRRFFQRPGLSLNGKAKHGDIDAILDQIRDEWEFVIDPEFNNVDLALQLLDTSSLGKDIDSFRRTKLILSRALKGSVDRHYEAFAAALPHHATLQSHLGVTSQQIKEMRTLLTEAKDALGSKRADLVQLWTRSQMLEEMVKLLDQIEHLKMVPDLLETLISEKRLLQASVLLVRSLKMINKPDMLEIGAVADLRSYLVSQETALRDILIDELQSHLYLKSFWCESRWSSYVPNQQTFQKAAFEDEPLPSEILNYPASGSDGARPSRLTRYLNNLTLRPNDPPYDLEEPCINTPSVPTSGIASKPSLPSLIHLTSQPSAPQRNPEADSFAYMETLLESLAVLGKLGAALDAVAQRIQTELYSLVESTLEEVEDRAEYSHRASMLVHVGATAASGGVFVIASREGAGHVLTQGGQGPLLSASRLRLAALESSSKEADHLTLKDLFWTVYSKLDAVTQGLRLIYEVSNRIGSRRDFKDSSGAKPGTLFPLADVLIPVQAEVRALLYDYLADEEQGAVSGRNPISSINEILRDGKYTRDRSKHIFRFADADIKVATKALKQHEAELTRVLRDTMPGLAQASSEQAVQLALATVGTGDRILGTGQRHRTLIHPDAFHVTVLFRPTLNFLSRIVDILPSGLEAARSSSGVLDEFVLKVYLPQLEEKVSMLFQQIVMASDAFQPDPFSSRVSSQPLIKAATHLIALINSLCAILRSTPFHQENYSRLILSVVIQFYQRCSDRFQDLVSLRHASDPVEEPRLVLAAQWAQKPEFNSCLSELLSAVGKGADAELQLSKQETQLESQALGQGVVAKEDLIPSMRNLSALGTLHHSVVWLSEQLRSLRPQESIIVTSPEKPETASTATPFSPYPLSMPVAHPEDELRFPLSREMTLRFHALLRTYEQLAELILDTIRIDVRCRTIHHIHAALQLGNYVIEREAGEPDPHIIDLNAELSQCDEFTSVTLPPEHQRFVFVGLGHLMEHLLIANARHIRLANTFGIKKILRNMLALQQGIRTITNDAHAKDFERAKCYYDQFFMSPPDMLASIRQKPLFTFDEYKTMLRLQCGVDQKGGDAAIAQAQNRNYNMYVIDLHGLELEEPPEDQKT